MSALLVGAVLVLLLFAGVDALRSWFEENERDRAAAVPQQPVSPTSFAPCEQEQLEAAIEVRGGIATNVIRHVSVTACHQDAMRLRLTIWDRAGRRVWRRDMRGQFEGNYARMLVAVSEQTVRFLAPNNAIHRCHQRGPFVALAQIGPYITRARGLSADEIGCP